MAHIPQSTEKYRCKSVGCVQWNPKYPKLGVRGPTGVAYHNKFRITLHDGHNVWMSTPFCPHCKYIIRESFPQHFCVRCRIRLRYKKVRHEIMKGCTSRIQKTWRNVRYKREKMCRLFGATYFPKEKNFTENGLEAPSLLYGFTKKFFEKDGVEYIIKSNRLAKTRCGKVVTKYSVKKLVGFKLKVKKATENE